MKEQKPPISEGEEVNVRIESVGEKGDGIARVHGFVVFIPDVQAGDECKIKVTKVLQKVGFGKKLGDADGDIVNPPRAPRQPRATYKPITELAPPPEDRPEDTDDFGADLDEDEDDY